MVVSKHEKSRDRVVHHGRGSVMRLLGDRDRGGGGRGGQSLLDARTAVGVLARTEAEDVVVNVAELPEEQEQEDRSREDVEDTVPDHLGGDGDDVAALSAGPCDRVGDQHEGEEACADHVAGAERLAGGECSAWGVPEEHVPGDTIRIP